MIVIYDAFHQMQEQLNHDEKPRKRRRQKVFATADFLSLINSCKILCAGEEHMYSKMVNGKWSGAHLLHVCPVGRFAPVGSVSGLV